MLRIVLGLRFYSCKFIQVTLMDTDRSHKTLGSETEHFITHKATSGMSILFLLPPWTSKSLGTEWPCGCCTQSDLLHSWGILSLGNLSQQTPKEPTPFSGGRHSLYSLRFFCYVYIFEDLVQKKRCQCFCSDMQKWERHWRTVSPEILSNI